MKMSRSLMLAAATLALSFGALTGAEARGFTAKDMVTLDRVSDPKVSPDGRYVLYAVRTMDYDANKASMSVWLADLTGKVPAKRLKISDGGASSARWSTDGQAIYFVSSRAGGTDQVFRTTLAGDAAVQVTKMPFDVGAYRVAADGKSIVVAQAVFPDCDTLACTQERLNANSKRKTTGVVYDRLFVRHWDTWADGTRNHLFAVKLDAKGVATGEPVDLMKGFDGDAPTKPFGGEEDFVISPDSGQIVFSAKVAGKTEAWTTNFDLWAKTMPFALKPLDPKVEYRLTNQPYNTTAKNLAWDAAPTFSPDGKQQAYLAMKRPGFEADRFAVMLRTVDAKGQYQDRELAADWDRSASSLTWSRDGKTLYVIAEDVGQTRIFAIDVASGKATPVTGPGHVSGFDVGPRGLVYVQDDLKAPAQLFTADLKGANPAALTDLNKARLQGVDMGDAEQFSFPGWNGETVHGYLVKPANFDPSKKYPVAFLIHGGPQGSFGNLFHYRWNAQTYAGAGYAVVMVDFHGSTGYGQKFTDAISQHWGDRPLEDLQKGWGYALSKYSFLDGDRACALGGSYGGFMVNWIAGNWNKPWKCLVNHDGIFDSRFMGSATEELWFSEWENGGTVIDKPEAYEKFNPVNHIANWTTPMLVIEGGRDYRVPLEQALSTFTTLQRKGIDSRFLYYPDENHWVLKAQNSVQWHDEVLGWLDKYTAEKKK